MRTQEPTGSVARGQLRWLAETLSTAERLPAYRGALSAIPARLDPRERLRRMPVLERAEIQASPEAFRNPARRAIELHTSGSTGTPLRLYLDRTARLRRLSQYTAFYLRHGWRPWHRSLSLKVLPDSSARLGSSWVDRTVLARRRACSILEPIDKQYELLEATDPEVLHGPPSVVHELAARARARRWRPSELRRTFTSSEALDRGVRERIEDALGAPVIDHYGAAEAFVGWECELRSGFHVNVRSVFVELLDDEADPVAPGEIGRVVITTLDNAAMPLIRYAIGDMAIAADGPCACGRPGPVLREVLGRRIDLFQLNGRLLSPWGLVARMREVEFVRQFQIVQTEGDAVRVVFSRRDGSERVDPGAIAALAAEELGNDVRVETREVDHIERLASGKYAPAVNLATTPAAVA